MLHICSCTYALHFPSCIIKISTFFILKNGDAFIEKMTDYFYFCINVVINWIRLCALTYLCVPSRFAHTSDSFGWILHLKIEMGVGHPLWYVSRNISNGLVTQEGMKERQIIHIFTIINIFLYHYHISVGWHVVCTLRNPKKPNNATSCF